MGSQALQQMEKHIDHELVHLNKHQRKTNRRFLKLRHRLRKVYHFDGAPRKMVELVQEIKRKKIAEEAKRIASGGAAADSAAAKIEDKGDGKAANEDSSEIAMSSDED